MLPRRSMYLSARCLIINGETYCHLRSNSRCVEFWTVVCIYSTIRCHAPNDMFSVLQRQVQIKCMTCFFFSWPMKFQWSLCTLNKRETSAVWLAKGKTNISRFRFELYWTSRFGHINVSLIQCKHSKFGARRIWLQMAVTNIVNCLLDIGCLEYNVIVFGL